MNGLHNILWYYGQTRYFRKFKTRQQLRTWQHQQVLRLLRTVLPKSPFYREYYADSSLTDWQHFPLLTKALMMENFDRLNTVGIHKADAFALAQQAEQSRDFRATLNGYTVGLSSGTSGHRGLFVVSPVEQQAWAGTILAKALPKPLWIKQRIAFFLRANSSLYETVQHQRIQFQYFDLLHPLADHLERLQEYQPDILVAPPSLLRLLATAQRQGKLAIFPEKVISVAEVLDPLDQHHIQAGFQQPVHQLYQCTEGFLAATCSFGTLHLNEEIVVIQKDYLNQDQGKFVPIITDFRRESQPILRYRLDDILTERLLPCPCGSIMTALEQIEGRQDDIFYLPSQSSPDLIPLFPDFIRRAILLASEAIREYRVVQVSPVHIQIALHATDLSGETVQTAVSQQLLTLCQRVRVQAPRLEYIPYQPHTHLTQKLRRVERQQ